MERGSDALLSGSSGLGGHGDPPGASLESSGERVGEAQSEPEGVEGLGVHFGIGRGTQTRRPGVVNGGAPAL